MLIVFINAESKCCFRFQVCCKIQPNLMVTCFCSLFLRALKLRNCIPRWRRPQPCFPAWFGCRSFHAYRDRNRDIGGFLCWSLVWRLAVRPSFSKKRETAFSFRKNRLSCYICLDCVVVKIKRKRKKCRRFTNAFKESIFKKKDSYFPVIQQNPFC